MKVKLLKRIRKRWAWYINSNGYPVLIDKYNKEVIIMNIKYYATYFNHDTIEKAIEGTEVSKEELCWRLMLNIIIKPFGYNWGNILYTRALNLSKKRKNKSK